ncbi:DUF983 domain-containing protein [Telluribacter sp. SYSU D00476]|uniref:DUF983 domain-containing protein n=1 Tax=Telluribacter sp. SYSU D00476 TaxID=2811430 RepID=UPI001FF34ADE|nr:DUF983 domain-containing protein [Telluribacter sp. SYSU D00476]
MLKGTKIYSILANKCPRCHEGDFFQIRNPYDLKNFDKLHDRCPCCDENFVREPGFYIGSMYISYALSTALTVVTFVLFVVLLGCDVLSVLYVLLPAFVFLLPVSFRTARLIWINIFVRYNRQRAQQARQRKPEVA